MTCPLGDPRIILETAAELDPDTYVPILDSLDAGDEDLEDSDLEEGCDDDVGPDRDREMSWHYATEVLHVREFCPCCGSLTRVVEEYLL